MHIADVSFFVPAGTPLDQGAARRAFSTYVPGKVAPMLPHDLADDLCSLRPHQDRLCVTVEIPPHGEPSFYRSVIRSDARLTYGQAQRRDAEQHILEALDLNDELAQSLRAKRFARGALQVQTPEVVFRFDGRGGVAEAWLEGEPHAHMLVEELMILANELVGAFLAGRRRETLYRVHEQPDPLSVEHLLAKLANLGVPTPPAPDRLTPQQAAKLAGEISSRDRRVRRAVGARAGGVPGARAARAQAGALRPAQPRPLRPREHGVRHFTSPIRRYPDLITHRSLLRELGLADDHVPDDLVSLGEHASEREREAAKLEYLADDICLAWLLDKVLFERGWEEEWEGEITGIINSGLFVRFGDVFEGFLPARRLHGEFFELNDLGTALDGARDRERLPPRRPDRRARRGDRQERRQGRARTRARSAAARAPSASARARDESCSFRSTLETCASTVFTERCRRAAISL